MRVLIVVDVQNDFVSGSLGSCQAQNSISSMKKIISTHKGPVICTLDTHNQDYLSTLEGKNLPIIHCQKGEWGHKLVEEVENVLRSNNQYPIFQLEKDTFGSLKLILKLKEIFEKYKEEKIESIDFIGICTDICVVSNVLLVKSAFSSLPLRVFQNACAGTNEENHLAALSVLRSCQVEILSV